MAITACNLKVVLLSKGPGADADALRPNRDDSQWWGRRDASVRCISSFLFSPRPETGSRELVFLFDDDLAKMTIKVSKNCRTVPTEKNIIAIWKKAAQRLNTTIEENGMECLVEVDPTFRGGSSSSSSSSGGDLPPGLDSKRQILEFLQKKCPMDFLRSKGLNSNMNIILRKMNKKALLSVFNDWKDTQESQKRSPAVNDAGAAQREKTFREVLFSWADGEPKSSRLIAGTLHEVFQEYPCFGLANNEEGGGGDAAVVAPFRLVLFLGAVRDMSQSENDILRTVCEESDVPLIGIRFGTVPEFTSKILSILAFHHCHDAIALPVGRLLRSDAGQALAEEGGRSEVSRTPEAHELRVVCAVPLRSARVSVDLNDRCRVHWCLVRIIVCTLWRSRFVSADRSVPLKNSLHLIFRDGVSLDLDESAFVSKLANKHQAAPCEYQILVALREEIDAAADSAADDAISEKKAARRVMKRIVKEENPDRCLVLGLNSEASDFRMPALFYREDESRRSRGRTVMLLLAIGTKTGPKGKPKGNAAYEALVRAAGKRNFTVVEGSMFDDPDCEDYEATTIIALQHLCNQNKLFLREEAAGNKKRKRDGRD